MSGSGQRHVQRMLDDLDSRPRRAPGAAGPDHHMKHELVLLAGKIDWDWFDGDIAPLYSENGRLGISGAARNLFVAAPLRLQARLSFRAKNASA